MKKLISILLTAMLICLATVTAFATEDVDLCMAKFDIHYKVDAYKEEFLLNGGLMGGPDGSPLWSVESKKEMEKTIDFINSKIDTCTTVEEVEELEKTLMECADKMYLEPEELRWLLEFMQKDYQSVGYYDKTTTIELKKIYEDARDAYDSGDGDRIFTNYLMLRNEFNKLCLYNPVIGDVNLDGIFSIDDVTYMQNYLTGIKTMNSSQLYICGIIDNYGIDCVTDWQKCIADIDDSIYRQIERDNNRLINYNTFDVNNKNKFEVINGTVDLSNYLYNDNHAPYFDYYYKNCY